MKATPKDKAEYSRLDQMAIERLAGKEAVSLPVLVGDLSRDLGYTTDEVTEGLMALQSRKVIVIAEKSPYASLASYAVSPISLWFWAAVGATILSVLLLSVTSGVAVYLRYAFGSILVLFLPGYSLIEALYPKRELDELTRFALSIGLSLALVPLVGLVLNYTPFGLRLLPVALSLSGLTLVLLVTALRRKHAYYKVAKDLA
jgi:Protein of unknown function (DUF1616)